MGKFLKIIGAIVLVVVLAVVGMLAWAFAGQTDYQATGAVGDLEVAFADPEWGGEALPEGMWCDRYEGSNAMSPSLLVAGVPTDANAIIVNFNDEMVFFLDEGGTDPSENRLLARGYIALGHY